MSTIARAMIVVTVFVQGCSKESGGRRTDECADAFSSAAAIGAFGGASYGGVVALSFGMSCAALKPDELKCIQQASSKDELQHCGSAADNIAASVAALSAGRTGGQEASPEDVATLSNAVCACKDAVCIVGVGRKQRALLERITVSAMPTDDASKRTRGRLVDCLGKVGSTLAARSPSVSRASSASGSTPTSFSCTDAGKGAADMMGFSADATDLRNREAAQVEALCREDRWSESAISCFVAEPKAAQPDQFKCVDALSPAQREGWGDLQSGRRHPKIETVTAAAPNDVAAAAVRKLANEAFPQWAMSNPDKRCPSTDDLGSEMDPWGNPYRMSCGDSLPAGVHDVAVWSAGPDGTDGNDDDVRSW